MEVGLNKEEFSIFAQDAMLGSIAVGGTCPNGCIFCCLIGQKAIGRQNWTNHISEADLNEVKPFINALKPNNDCIYFGEGPTFLSCEPFKHPQYLQLLKNMDEWRPDLNKKASTVGKFVKEEDFEAIKKMNVNFIVSVNSLDPGMRKRMMRSKDKLDTVMSFLKECEPQIEKISLIYGGDLDVLRRDIETLHSIHPNYKTKIIKFSLPDYSKYHSEEAKKLFDDAYATWFEAVRLGGSLHREFSPLFRSLAYFPQDFYDIWDQQAKKLETKMETVFNIIRKNKIDLNDIGFLVSESVVEYVLSHYPTLNKNGNIILAKNITFGGSYVVSGLLSKNDIIHAVENHHKRYKYYVLPKNIFDEFDRDIAGFYRRDYDIGRLIIV